jgi:hypothetical protein
MTDSELDDFVLAGARVLGLPIEEAWKPAIRAHLEVSFRLAARVMEFDLPDETEPAPVFGAASAYQLVRRLHQD